MPLRMQRLARDARGFPVPWFVQWFNAGEPCEYGYGTPDFRVADIRKLGQAVSHGCVRMANADVVKLFDQVQIGTTVIVEP